MEKCIILLAFYLSLLFSSCGCLREQEMSHAFKRSEQNTQAPLPCLAEDGSFWTRVDSVESNFCSTELSKLDTSDPISLVKLKMYLQNTTPQSTEEGDSIFRLAQNIHNEIVASVGESFVCPVDYQWSREKKEKECWRKISSFRIKYGMNVTFRDHKLVVIPNFNTTAQLCFSHCSQEVQDFISQQSKDEKEGFVENGILLISYQQLGNRIIAWENYQKEHPEGKLSDRVSERIQTYTETYLYGTPKSGLYDNERQELLPVVRRTYEEYMESYPEYQSTQQVKQHYDLLKENDFKELG